MTTVFVYEWCTATGLGRAEADPAHSLFREGRAMRDAVAADLRRVPGVEAFTVDGVHPVAEPVRVGDAARRADHSLLIAPEFGGVLEQLARLVTARGGRLLGPGPDAVRLCGDKFDLARRWRATGVPTPRTSGLEGWSPAAFPVVVKARDGVGSDYVRRCDSPAEVDAYRAELADEHCHRPMVVQDFVPGRPASVAFLVGPAEPVPLVPTFQLLTDDGRFRYVGGELPIPPALAARAVALGRRAINCVPGLAGYVGVDLVLGDAADGSGDHAIEINPRLTTSYVGLRALADTNLAEAMLRVAQGEPAGELRWKPGRVRFRPDGGVEYDPTSGATFA